MGGDGRCGGRRDGDSGAEDGQEPGGLGRVALVEEEVLGDPEGGVRGDEGDGDCEGGDEEGAKRGEEQKDEEGKKSDKKEKKKRKKRVKNN